MKEKEITTIKEFKERFQIIGDIIGWGYNGVVYKAKDDNNAIMAKIVMLSKWLNEEQLQLATQEPKMLKTINHPHIMKVYEYLFVTENEEHVLIEKPFKEEKKTLREVYEPFDRILIIMEELNENLYDYLNKTLIDNEFFEKEFNALVSAL